MDDMPLADFVFLLVEDRRSFKNEAEWVEACKGDASTLDVSSSRPLCRQGPRPRCLTTVSRTRQVTPVRKTRAAGGDSGRLGEKLPLMAYSKQVAGHSETLLMMGSAKLCKPMRDVELSVYLAVFDEGDGDAEDDTLGAEARHVLRARALAPPEVRGPPSVAVRARPRQFALNEM